jgi:hypothetical protein
VLRDLAHLLDVPGRTPTADRLVKRLPPPVNEVVRRLRGEDVFMLAAGLTFYALVSVAPLPSWSCGR